MYVTIDSVMLQVQRYLHVNRQKETFAKSGRSLLKESSCYATYRKMYRSLDRPGKGWPLVNVRNMPGHLMSRARSQTCRHIIGVWHSFKRIRNHSKRTIPTLKEKKRKKAKTKKLNKNKKVWRLRANVFN